MCSSTLCEGTLGKKELAKVAQVSLTTGYNVKPKIKKSLTLSHKKGGGRPKSLRNSIKPTLCQQVRRKPFLSLRNLASQSGINVSFSTVGRAMNDLKYNKRYTDKTPMLSEKNRIYRIKWAKKYRYPKKLWFQTIFLDEMSVWLSRGRIKIWTKSGKKKRLAPTTKHTPKIHVWAAFSSMGTLPLCISTQNMNSDLFIDILQTHLFAQAEVFHENQWRLVMDNNPKHTSIKVQKFLHEKIPIPIPWPSQSPDLNPIENLFSCVKFELMIKGPKTISALKKCLEEIWESIQTPFLRPYCESMINGY